ncbi:LuxR C-terminal-related transcriptional regulator [Actinosynnema sp. NPDC053489]|uniref:helix-turn-helix domain-containing protein n=1 Tax=Actinosynnema sp. NPDC053489 TaxID=3363916 RepID=UPI0037CA8B39
MTTTGADVLPLPIGNPGGEGDGDAANLVEHAFRCLHEAAESLALATRLLSDPGAGPASPRPVAGPPGDDRFAGSRLTGQERRVLTLLAAGLSNRHIGQALDISDKTAKNHVHTILTKLNAGSRTEAAFTALRERLVDPEECLRARTSSAGSPHRATPN